MKTKIRCALTVTEWSIVLMALMREEERLVSQKTVKGAHAGTIYSNLCSQLNRPDLIDEAEPGELIPGTAARAPGLIILKDTDLAREPLEEVPSPEPKVTFDIEQEEVPVKVPSMETVTSSPDSICSSSVQVKRDEEGNIIPPKINLPM